jgi:hypothetical protein
LDTEKTLKLGTPAVAAAGTHNNPVAAKLLLRRWTRAKTGEGHSLNATQAARAAGFAKSSANVQGSRG